MSATGSPPPVVLCLNGPNLGQLGRREPALYGTETLAAILDRLEQRASARGVGLVRCTSNHEGELIDALERAPSAIGAICNPGGLSHTSLALRDAYSAFGRPVVEVHLSNVHAREPFRHRLLTAGAARGVVSGLGAYGYELALDAVLTLWGKEATPA